MFPDAATRLMSLLERCSASASCGAHDATTSASGIEEASHDQSQSTSLLHYHPQLVPEDSVETDARMRTISAGREMSTSTKRDSIFRRPKMGFSHGFTASLPYGTVLGLCSSLKKEPWVSNARLETACWQRKKP